MRLLSTFGDENALWPYIARQLNTGRFLTSAEDSSCGSASFLGGKTQAAPVIENIFAAEGLCRPSLKPIPCLVWYENARIRVQRGAQRDPYTGAFSSLQVGHETHEGIVMKLQSNMHRSSSVHVKQTLTLQAVLPGATSLQIRLCCSITCAWLHYL